MDKDELVIFWFYHIFEETYIYIHRSHIDIIYWPKAKILLNLLLFPPLRDLEELYNTRE